MSASRLSRPTAPPGPHGRWALPLSLTGLIGLMAAGWLLGSAGQGRALPLPAHDPLAEWVAPEWLGASGRLRAVVLATAAPHAPAGPLGLLADSLMAVPGIHAAGLVTPAGEPFRLMTLVPFAEKRGAGLNGYRMGRWPGERSRNPLLRAELPAGFIEVRPEDRDVPLSLHFRLGDFLTKDQEEVWPKYLVLDMRLVDKLELLARALERAGRPSALQVMSGFRTPAYNALGIGRGRARDSQHMYGEAADVYVDGDGDGRMDDLDGDGRVSRRDAAFLMRIAESVEESHPDLAGGLSAYRATGAHGPFLHVDVRGEPARW